MYALVLGFINLLSITACILERQILLKIPSYPLGVAVLPKSLLILI